MKTKQRKKSDSGYKEKERELSDRSESADLENKENNT